jgi:hypothetical protein
MVMTRVVQIFSLIAGLATNSIWIVGPAAAADATPQIAPQNIDREKVQSKLLDIRSNIDQNKNARNDAAAPTQRVNVCSINPNLPQLQVKNDGKRAP